MQEANNTDRVSLIFESITTKDGTETNLENPELLPEPIRSIHLKYGILSVEDLLLKIRSFEIKDRILVAEHFRLEAYQGSAQECMMDKRANLVK